MCVCGWWEGRCDVIFNTTQSGVRTNFFVLEGGGGVLSKFLLHNSSFSAPPPPDNYCTVPNSTLRDDKGRVSS